MFPIKLKLPTASFTFKPVVPKPRKDSGFHKPLTRILYASAHKNEEGEWRAYVNTKGIEGYQEITILPFTEKSFELRGRNDVFRINKDKQGRWVRVIRSDLDAEFYPGNRAGLCTLCENCVFSGHIVKVEGILHFDMAVYKGTARECDSLLTMINKVNKNEE